MGSGTRWQRSKRVTRFAGHFLLWLSLAQVVQAAPTNLDFWFRGGQELREEVVQRWKADFEAKNSDITIEWEIPPGDWMTRFPVMVATGLGPDVLEVWGVNGRSWGENNLLMDVSPYVARDFSTQDIEDSIREEVATGDKHPQQAMDEIADALEAATP